MRQSVSRAIIVAFLVLHSAASIAAEKAILQIGMPEWCPYTCADEANPGILVEVTKQILESHGITPQFRIYDNWKRLVYEGRKGRVDAVLAIAPNEEPALIYPAETMADMTVAFFVRAEDDWTFRGIQSFDGKVVVAYDNVDYGPTIQPYVDEYKNNRSRIELATGETEEVLIRKIAAGRGDIYLEDKYVGLYMIQHEGLKDKIKEALNTRELEPLGMGIGFSPKFLHAQAYADIIDQGIQTMRDNGSLDAIITRYLSATTP
jgi:polar amino acid transport system substrate-binding protein